MSPAARSSGVNVLVAPLKIARAAIPSAGTTNRCWLASFQCVSGGEEVLRDVRLSLLFLFRRRACYCNHRLCNRIHGRRNAIVFLSGAHFTISRASREFRSTGPRLPHRSRYTAIRLRVKKKRSVFPSGAIGEDRARFALMHRHAARCGSHPNYADAAVCLHVRVETVYATHLHPRHLRLPQCDEV